MSLASGFTRPLKKHAGFLWQALVFLVIFLGLSAFQARNMLPSSDTPAPALQGALLGGGAWDLANSGNQPVLVYFFAPWCGFCAASSDNLTRLRRLRDEQSLQIVAVVLDWKDLDEVRQYVERHDLNLPVLLGDRRIAEDWHVYAFPTYYVLDSDRRIRRRDLGYSTQLGLLWRTWWLN